MEYVKLVSSYGPLWESGWVTCMWNMLETHCRPVPFCPAAQRWVLWAGAVTCRHHPFNTPWQGAVQVHRCMLDVLDSAGRSVPGPLPGTSWEFLLVLPGVLGAEGVTLILLLT